MSTHHLNNYTSSNVNNINNTNSNYTNSNINNNNNNNNNNNSDPFQKNQKQYQAYFQKKHYLWIVQDYNNSNKYSLEKIKSTFNSSFSKTPQDLILIAKGFFLRKQYKQCIKILNMIAVPHDTTTYILYERQMLLFKATYLLMFNINPVINNGALQFFNNKNGIGKDQKKSFLKQPQNINANKYPSSLQTKLQALKSILETYSINRTLVNGPPLNRFHAQAVSQMQKIMQLHQKQESLIEPDDLQSNSSQIHHRNNKEEGSIQKLKNQPKNQMKKQNNNQNKESYNQQRMKQLQEDMFKQLGKKKIFQGMPSFLISKQWLEKYQRYIKKIGGYPGPITNFTLINHISNMLFYTQPQKSYLNTNIFPLKQGDDYISVTFRQWKRLFDKFGGIPVKRFVSRQKGWRGQTSLQSSDTLIKGVIKYKKQDWVIQFPNNLYWQKHLLEILTKFFQQGQLKQFKLGSLDYSSVVRQDIVKKIDYPLHFYNIDFGPRRLEEIDQKRKKKIIKNFNLQSYAIQDRYPNININNNNDGGTKSMRNEDKYKESQQYYPSTSLKNSQQKPPENLPTGLTNMSNTCYLNSSLQCLRNIDIINEYFVTSQFLNDLNFTSTNKFGSYGLVTCAFADTLKGLWKIKDQRYGFNPQVFKEAFGQRYQDFDNYQQQDANEFLSFLLNCLHDDLNKNVQLKPRRMSVSQRDFQRVRDFSIQNQQSTNKSIITDLFQGYHYSEIHCEACNDKIHRFDIFLMLTLPLPPLAQNIQLFYIHQLDMSQEKAKSADQLTIYITNLKTVQDLIRITITRFIKDKRRKPEQYLFLAVQGKSFEIQKEIPHDMDINDLMVLKKKKVFIFFLYEIPQVQIKERQILTIVELKYDDDRIGYPRLIITDKDIKEKKKEEEFLEKFNYFLDGVGFQKLQRKKSSSLLGGSSGIFGSSSKKQDQQKQKQKKPCQKIKVQDLKSKSQTGAPTYARRIKAYLNRKYKLCYFNEINQPIGDTFSNIKYDLDTCFQISTAKQRIDQRQGWQCQKCRDQTVAHKQQTIFSAGEVLVICLKRFTQGQKITAKIDYPLKGLDISQYSHGSQLIIENSAIRTSKSNINMRKGTGQIIQEQLSNKGSSLIKPPTKNQYKNKNENQNTKNIYDLESVCIHRGTLHRGHYISYCKNPYDQKWYCFDDQTVREIPQEMVVSQNAYILFYRRRHEIKKINFRQLNM